MGLPKFTAAVSSCKCPVAYSIGMGPGAVSTVMVKPASRVDMRCYTRCKRRCIRYAERRNQTSAHCGSACKEKCLN